MALLGASRWSQATIRGWLRRRATTWPGGERHLLAHAGDHGAPVRWHAGREA
jgi:hypothetical protein